MQNLELKIFIFQDFQQFLTYALFTHYTTTHESRIITFELQWFSDLLSSI